MPTRIDQDLFEAAKTAGQVHSRSAAQQLDHWARIGRQLESDPGVTVDQVARVLAGETGYDGLDSRTQAVVRAVWDAQIDERAAALDFTDRLEAAGEPWAEADAEGKLRVRRPG